MNQAQRLEYARTVLHQAETASGLARVEDKGGWETPDVLHPILPSLTPGVITITGSATILLALAGHASTQGAWIALLGLPWVGWGAANEHGLDLSRTAHIPNPGPRAADVLTALADGFDIIAIGNLKLGARDERAIAQRVRARGATILASDWSTPSTVLRAESIGADGYSGGVGHVKTLRFQVSSGVSRSSCLWTGEELVSAPRALRAVPC